MSDTSSSAMPSTLSPFAPETSTAPDDAHDPARRHLLGQGASSVAAGLLAGWLPIAPVSGAQAATCATLTAFPAGIELYQQAFKNWAGDIAVDAVWTCAPRTPQDVLRVVNWALGSGYRVRPRGMMHNWSPLTLAPGMTCPRVVLVDTTRWLKAVSIDTRRTPAAVKAQTGVSMQALLQTMENSGLGMVGHPAPGDLTLGGVLAIDGHGTCVPALGEKLPTGGTWGSVSNLVLSLTAVVWDPAAGQYVLRTFNRNDPAIAALLTHVGRSFIVEATLQAVPRHRLRCRSYVNIGNVELFAPPGSGGRTFASFLDQSGRVETILFPFTSAPWLKVWSAAPTWPLLSRPVTGPYNYVFSDNLPPVLTTLIQQIITGHTEVTPLFGQTQAAIVAAGLASTLSFDLWGWAKDLLLYVKPTTLRVTANGYALLCRRADVQRVVHEFHTFATGLMNTYAQRGLYPMNGPIEIRVNGLDQPGEVSVAGAVPPALSALRPRPDHPEWNCAVWVDLLTLPGTAGAAAFYQELEQWIYANYSGSYAGVRVEWSKGWGYTATGAWSSTAMKSGTIPDSLSQGQAPGTEFESARSALQQLDPYRLFSSPMLDTLLP